MADTPSKLSSEVPDDSTRTPAPPASADSGASASEIEAHFTPPDAARPDSAPEPRAGEVGTADAAVATVAEPLSDPYATSARDERDERDAGNSVDGGNGDDESVEPPRDLHEGAVPPGYDWPTHGGYLGCLIGLMAACAVAGFLGGTWIPLIAAPSLAKLAISLIVALGALVGLGRLGWVLGKRFYREYPQPARGVRHLPSHEQHGDV